jgi:hypothetical protein
MTRKIRDPFTEALFPGLQDFGDIFSDDRLYRFRLWRIWDKAKQVYNAVMLNPTMITWRALDNTCLGCQRFVMGQMGGGIIISNAFALISTDPQALYVHPDPVGPGNDSHILACAKQADFVVVGWGNHAQHLGRSSQVLELITAAGKSPYCFEVNDSGEPRHPLYLPASRQLRPYPGARPP